MRCIALILALLAAGAADASAATVSAAVEIGDNGRAATFTTVVRYTAAAGEANRIGARQEGDVWRITDSGAPVAASGLCEAVGEHEAVCRLDSQDHEVVAMLGDGSDEAFCLGPVLVDGGAGDDRLVAYRALGRQRPARRRQRA